jgi:hypothetical protein
VDHTVVTNGMIGSVVTDEVRLNNRYSNLL